MPVDKPKVFFDGEVEPQISHIIEEASKSITFVTPYVRLWEHLKKTIDRAVARKVSVTFIVRVTEETANNEDLDWLIDHGVRLYGKDWLHAKIYLNESKVLLSSMNVTEWSATNALDYGLIVSDPEEAKLFRRYVSELIDSSDRLFSSNVHCIRCNGIIRLESPSSPFCDECYSSWASNGDESRKEKYCLICGKVAPVTSANPWCKRDRIKYKL